jgi:uncharacterized protein YbjT (DUF2867 family)
MRAEQEDGLASRTGGGVLLTGATGYVGGRLLRRLEERGVSVTCLSRRPETLAARAAPSTRIVAGDVSDAVALDDALDGADTAYYLIRSIGVEGAFLPLELETARSFSQGVARAGLRRVVCLGPLSHGGSSASLQARRHVGDILRESGCEVLELRIASIIGSGSSSFELVRAVVETVPILTPPSWTRVPMQPIAIEDLVTYLVAALDVPSGRSEVFEIGGSDVVTYQDLLGIYARIVGRKRITIPIPWKSRRLQSAWLALVTPLYRDVSSTLMDGASGEATVQDDAASQVFDVRPMSAEAAMRRALVNEDADFAETCWSDATPKSVEPSWGGQRTGSRLVDSRRLAVPCSPDEAFEPIRSIGGERGWYRHTWLWSLRGVMDQLAGGVGSSRGRRHPTEIAVGDVVDFWRVEALEDGRMLRLRSESRIPGRGWFQYEVAPGESGSTITQTAIFEPHGVIGLLYWYALWPAHQIVFTGTLKGLAQACLSKSGSR